jgi:hypothetical protein
MTYPDPDPHPSGPWGPRQLIEYARRNDWDHVVYSFGDRREHVWRIAEWQVNYERWEDAVGVLTVYERRRGLSRSWNSQRAEVVVTSATEVGGVLSALGVIPSEVAA